jgi:hypothetical protein
MPHKWERDGERCEKCGAKDWMNIPHCIDDEPSESSLIAQAESDIANGRVVSHEDLKAEQDT